MKNIFPRIVAFILVPCLLAQSASAFSGFTEIGRHAIRSVDGGRLTTEALAAPACISEAGIRMGARPGQDSAARRRFPPASIAQRSAWSFSTIATALVTGAWTKPALPAFLVPMTTSQKVNGWIFKAGFWTYVSFFVFCILALICLPIYDEFFKEPILKRAEQRRLAVWEATPEELKRFLKYDPDQPFTRARDIYRRFGIEPFSRLERLLGFENAQTIARHVFARFSYWDLKTILTVEDLLRLDFLIKRLERERATSRTHLVDGRPDPADGIYQTSVEEIDYSRIPMIKKTLAALQRYRSHPPVRESLQLGDIESKKDDPAIAPHNDVFAVTLAKDGTVRVEVHKADHDIMNAIELEARRTIVIKGVEDAVSALDLQLRRDLNDELSREHQYADLPNVIEKTLQERREERHFFLRFTDRTGRTVAQTYRPGVDASYSAFLDNQHPVVEISQKLLSDNLARTLRLAFIKETLNIRRPAMTPEAEHRNMAEALSLFSYLFTTTYDLWKTLAPLEMGNLILDIINTLANDLRNRDRTLDRGADFYVFNIWRNHDHMMRVMDEFLKIPKVQELIGLGEQLQLFNVRLHRPSRLQSEKMILRAA